MTSLPHKTRPKVSFHTRGRHLPHKDSYIIIDQCYVQYWPAITTNTPASTSTVAPAEEPLPILFVHGGGCSGAQWESTPDLRPGWAPLAARRGYEVYSLDTVDNGRSQRAPDRVRGDGEVEHRTAGEMWSRFRFGPADGFETREVFPDGQFPVESFDALVGAQMARRRSNDEVEARGIIDAINALGPCWVIAHSHGAALMTEILPEVTSCVRRMALIEPGGTHNVRNLSREVPTVVIWGDYIDVHDAWPKIARPFDDSTAEVIRLADVGIRGNSHFPMSDRNSDEVFSTLR